MKRKATVLVFGAAGQVGFELCRRPATGLNVVGLGKEAGDITNPQAIAQAFTQYHPTVVINAAAYTAVDRAESEPEAAFAVNRDGAAFLAAACAAQNIPLLHISTDYVFPGDEVRPYDEDAATGPLSVYGESKRAGEIAIREACPQHIILRTAWVFGAHGQNFVKTMLRLGAERPEMRVVDDQVGGPTPAAAIADVLLQLAGRSAAAGSTKGAPMPWGTYHFCGAPLVTWYGFACEVFTQGVRSGLLDDAPQMVPITTADYPTPAHRPAFSGLNCQRLQDVFALPAADWESGLKQVVDELNQRQKDRS
jgi:dTDP-4-dehydrorhamnose reductase